MVLPNASCATSTHKNVPLFHQTWVGPPMSLGRGFVKSLLKRSVYWIFESINKSLGPTQGSEDLQGQLSLHGGNVGPPVSVERFCEETSMKLRSSSVFVNIFVCIYDYWAQQIILSRYTSSYWRYKIARSDSELRAWILTSAQLMFHSELF
jgi:hypothetical protein